MGKKAFFVCCILFSKYIFAADYLLVGDSHSCGSFGSKLADLLIDSDNEITVYCAVSSSPQNWLRGTKPSGQVCQTYSNSNPQFQNCASNGAVPTLSSLLQAHSEAKVIVALGNNSLMSDSADSSYTRLSALLEGRTCYWVGPPHQNPSQSRGFPAGRVQTLQNNLNSFYDSLENSIGSCTLIDSRPFTANRTAGHSTTDGVHRNNTAGNHWATKVFEEIQD